MNDNEPQDAVLIERVATQDRDAFEELYRRYVRAVLGQALRRLGDRGGAENATRETFAAVWRAAGSYDRARGPGGAWLFTVARTTIVDALRRRPDATEVAGDEIVSDAAGPDAEAEAAWIVWRVHVALETLPDPERPLIELAYYSGLSQSEIASFLEIPLGTVKTRTRSALARLAAGLEGEP